ncbi:MAG: serine O-acetyltransferase [Dorea sp.]|nr:serine O-acetyltransferase [Dorea sp.]
MDKKIMDERMGQALLPIVDAVLSDYELGRAIDNTDDLYRLPDKEAIIDIVNKMLRLVFPGYHRDKAYKSYNVNHNLSLLIEDVAFHLAKQIEIILKRTQKDDNKTEEAYLQEAQDLTIAFLQKLPKIREYVDTDIQATYDGDPAAYSNDEIILAYPGLFAITINRLAHELFIMGVPLIPRIMTEYAHSETGIDIHPGATIGKYFFIDHGTGIVVGETTVIGEHVKVYQGVTLGALSTRGGQKLRNKRRHPTIEDYVTIYAGASILGGDTVIGRGSVVGSNAFITKSIAPDTKVSIKNQELQYKQGGPKKSEPVAGNFGQDQSWSYNI